MHKVALFFLFFLLSGCATTKIITIEKVNPRPQQIEITASAWALSVDITPPPGMPMGGYSIMANKGQGFRTRLKARVIYLNDESGRGVALVQTDLTASSLLLHHKISSAVAKRTGLHPGDIVITASHSHSAPANFFENNFYNKHMSSGKWLNERYLDFVTQRISTGIFEAYAKRRPAKVASGSISIYGYNRNRSIEAYVLNAKNGKPDSKLKETIFSAVNPALNMIRIDVKNEQGDFFPLAAFSSFSVHATAITPQVEVYSADLFAYAQKDLEWAIERKYQTDWSVVHAMTTGTQGDMAPALTLQGDNHFGHFDLNWKEAKKLGQSIGREAIQLFESLEPQLTSKISLNTVAHEINIRQNNKIDGVEICQDAAIGLPVVGGAYERRTPWLSVLPFFKAGHALSHRWFFTDGCQGNKAHAGFSFFQPVLEPKASFPQIVMFQLIKINDTVIVPLPFEVTVEAGRRIVDDVKRELNSDEIRNVWVASNANGYFGYATTPEEYSRQNYEGAHTLYGRNSTPYIRKQLVTLSRSLLTVNRNHKMLTNWRYPVKIGQFYPEEVKSSGNRYIIEEAGFYQSRVDAEENYVSVKWLDVGPGEINFHEPLSKIEIFQNQQWVPLVVNGEPISDEGYDLEVRFLEQKSKGMGEYEVRWYNPIPGGYYRFTFEQRSGQASLNSLPFLISSDNDIQWGCAQ